MTTIPRSWPRVLPPLIDGQRLDRDTFHERYAAMPPATRADLVDGVVYMASPLHYPHGGADDDVGGWLYLYRLATPGVDGVTNVSTRTGPRSEVQPDRQLRILPECGGRSRVEGGFVVGAPELVVEVADSSRSLDLGPKRLDYERNGVPEYLFVGVDPAEVRWFSLREGRYEELAAGADGILRSEVFPGLWLDPAALLDRDSRRTIATLDRGLASPEHAAFVARLAEAAP